MKQTSNTFVTKCPFCGKTNSITKDSLRQRVLGVGVNVYYFDQFCSNCGKKIGNWRASQKTDTSTVIYMDFKGVRIPDVWKTTIFMNPPRDRRRI